MDIGPMSKPLFERFAADFASSRPGYPAEIKDFLFDKFAINEDSLIADIACGSGIFTQLMACKQNTRLTVGVDMSLALMRAGLDHFGRYCFSPLCGAGEEIPLKSGSVDMVSVAQGFHWMNRQKSLAEITRVIKPGGGIALVWYRRASLTEPHQKFIEDLTYKYNPNYDPKFMDADYAGMLIQDGNFTDIGQKRFFASKTYDLPTYIRWQRSKSFIGDAMDESMLDEFLEKVERAMQRFFPEDIITEDFKYDLIYGRRK